MVGWSKDEAASRLIETALESCRIEFDLNAETLQHIGGADATADRAITVLGDGHADCCRHHRGGGRNIKGAGAVTSGAGGIEHVAVVQVERTRPLAHRARTARKLGGRFALHLERDQKAGDQRVGRHVVENFADHAFGFDRVERSSL